MTVRRLGPAILFCAGLLAADTYRAQIESWRHDRENSLKSDNGWLTVAGLFWLHEGANPFGVGSQYSIDLPAGAALKEPGAFDLRNGKVTMRLHGQMRELRDDTSGHPDIVTLGSISFFVIERSGRYGIRVKDPNSSRRLEFTGLHYFPVNETYRITTRLVPDPKKIPVPNVLGQVNQTTSPGYVEFQLHGQKLRLTPVEESPGELSFIFRDLTSGKETYGTGRFLDTQLGKGGEVVLDFNKAYNPPCAFTPYATCPLPPKENRLPVRIEAGEMKYGSH